MSVTVEFTIGDESFPLGALLRGGSDRGVEATPLVPLHDGLLSYVRVYGDGLDGFERRVSADGRVDDLRRFGTEGGGRVYRLDAGDGRSRLCRCLDACGAVVESTATAPAGGGWRVVARFPGSDDASAFHRRCHDHGLDIDVVRVSSADGGQATGAGLSRRQSDLLVRAYEAGYFEVPRETKMGELAAELGVSDQTLSERLRRAAGALVRTSLL